MSNTEFLKPAPGGIVRHPNGTPVKAEGENLPLNAWFLYYKNQRSLIPGDDKEIELAEKLAAAEATLAGARSDLEEVANAENPDADLVAAAEDSVKKAQAAVEKAAKALETHQNKNRN